MALLTTVSALLIAVVSGYALLCSQSSIPKLQKYEKHAEKAAEWSRSAEKRLWDTRYTVGAGFVASLLSFLSAVYYACLVPTGFGLWPIGWAVLLAGGERYTSQYMLSFWADKAKVPLLDEYNDAISESLNVSKVLDTLTAGWAVIAILKVLGL